LIRIWGVIPIDGCEIPYLQRELLDHPVFYKKYFKQISVQTKNIIGIGLS